VIAPVLAAITRYLASAEAAHFDETGFRTAGKLASRTTRRNRSSG
jgi:hypothetical protein